MAFGSFGAASRVLASLGLALLAGGLAGGLTHLIVVLVPCPDFTCEAYETV